MNEQRINEALRQASDTRKVVIHAGALARVNTVFQEVFGDQPAAIIADENTFAVAGRAVQQIFQAAGRECIDPYIFPGSPTLYADYANVEKVEAATRAHKAIPVAVGSGTLNDLTKLASHHCARPYMVVATAASMDGYTAFGAAITRDGFKQTFSCPAPQAVVGDLDILVRAPLNMTASGYADLLGKVTAGADWIIADELGIEPIHRPSWSLVQESLRAWTANPALLRAGDAQTISFLLEGLILTGISMQTYHSSRTASGSEHQFSHLWEMHETAHGAISHGFKVGVGSIASAALYERLLTRNLSALDIPALCRAWPTREQLDAAVRQAHSIPIIVEKALEQSRAKYISTELLAERLMLLRKRWPILRERLQTQLLSASALRDLLSAAGCPVHPSQIGKDLPELKASYARARQIRSRYTVFDLAAESGTFDACVDELFAPGGFWA